MPMTMQTDCEVCHERIEKREKTWVHAHSGDTFCGTGDGATAWPPEWLHPHLPRDHTRSHDGQCLDPQIPTVIDREQHLAPQKEITMSETPVVTPPAAEPELTREQKLSKAHSTALSQLTDAHRDEFNELKTKAAAELGVEWKPRKSPKEKAIDDIEAVLDEFPELRDELRRKLIHEASAKTSVQADPAA